MKTEWKNEKCASLPEEFQRIADDTYIQRRNIRKVEVDEETEGNEELLDGGYECESRRISVDVYEALQEEFNSPAYMETKALLENQAELLVSMQLEVAYGVCLQELNMEM